MKKVCKVKKMNAIICGASAGIAEALICHPLDVMKTYLQQSSVKSDKSVITRIYSKQGLTGFYRGIETNLMSIPLKNGFRFGVFETFMVLTKQNLLWSGFMAGALEFIIVNPFDVCKIRVLSQYHSIHDPKLPQYKNSFHAFQKILVNEGIHALYKGSTMTILRQSINQSSNFYTFYKLKQSFPDCPNFLLGFISGSIGPILNNPIDVIKTRSQTQPNASIMTAIRSIRHVRELYNGLIPRLLRIAPGQAITFSVYEILKKII